LGTACLEMERVRRGPSSKCMLVATTTLEEENIELF